MSVITFQEGKIHVLAWNIGTKNKIKGPNPASFRFLDSPTVVYWTCLALLNLLQPQVSLSFYFSPLNLLFQSATAAAAFGQETRARPAFLAASKHSHDFLPFHLPKTERKKERDWSESDGNIIRSKRLWIQEESLEGGFCPILCILSLFLRPPKVFIVKIFSTCPPVYPSSHPQAPWLFSSFFPF